MPKPVLLGMCPGEEGFEPLDPSQGAGKFLIELVGDKVFNQFDRTNVFHRTTWSRFESRRRSHEIFDTMEGRIVMVFGNEAWASLSLPVCNWFDYKDVKGATWYRCPHPSGRNRMYNDEKNVSRLRLLLQLIASVHGDKNGKEKEDARSRFRVYEGGRGGD